MPRFLQPVTKPGVKRPGIVRTGILATSAPARSLSAESRPDTPQSFAAADRSIGIVTVLLGAYMLMMWVPFAEILITYLGIHIPIVVILGVALTVALPFTAHIGRFWRSPLAKPWIALLALYILAAVFGDYRGRSVPFILEYGVRFHLLPLYACAIALSIRRVRHLLYWGAAGNLLLLALSAKYGQVIENRFAIPQTSLSNPNDFAFTLLLAVTCTFILLYTNSVFSRALWFVIVPVSLLYVLKTGSRANFITLLVLAGAAFWMSSKRAKVLMLIGAPVLAAALTAFVPAASLQRLTLIFADPEQVYAQHAELRGAVGSQIARSELQKRAMELAIHRPVLGVGALNFEDSVERMVRAETGLKSGWQGAHNSYLEIAAENGIPAVLLYLAILGICLKLNCESYRFCKRHSSRLGAVPQSLCLILLTLAFAVGVLFSNSAYDLHLDLIVALSAANALAIQREFGAEARLPSSLMSVKVPV